MWNFSLIFMPQDQMIIFVLSVCLLSTLTLAKAFEL